jgi:hypothetical protein
MKKRKRIMLISLSLLHAALLLFFTFWLLERNYTYGDEKFLIKWSSVVKKMVLGVDTKPPRSDFLFINTCYDNMLIDKLDDDGLPLGNQVVTDRAKLAKLFEILNKTPDGHKYILCDIFFEDESSADNELNAQLQKTKNIIIPYLQEDTGNVKYPIFNINKGLAIYNKISGSFLKYTLLRNDSLKSIPLKMHEDISKSQFSKNGIFSYLNNKLCLNNVIIDFKIRYYDILEEKSPDPYPSVNLGELLSLSDSLILQSVKDRIVLIGDLKDLDIHSTAIGDMPGVLVLLNTYLTLKNDENTIKSFMLILLFISYFLISTDVFSSKSFSDREIVQKLSKNKFGKFIVKFLGYVVYLSVISLIIYFLYNMHINILIIAAYFKSFDSALTFFRKKPEIKNKHIFSKIRYKIFIILNK